MTAGWWTGFRGELTRSIGANDSKRNLARLHVDLRAAVNNDCLRIAVYDHLLQQFPLGRRKIALGRHQRFDLGFRFLESALELRYINALVVAQFDQRKLVNDYRLDIRRRFNHHLVIELLRHCRHGQ